MAIIQNTKNFPYFLNTLEDYIYNKHKYCSFVCVKCGKFEIKREVSIEKLIKNNIGLICGPCLRKQGNIEKHGDPNYNNQKKSKQTMFERYGVENAFQLQKVIEQTKSRDWSKRNQKLKKTCLKKYGVDNYAKTNECKEKIKKTCLKRYGVEHPMKSPNIFNKIFKNIYYDNEYFDSSWELSYWIWCKNNNKNIQRNKKRYKLENDKYFYPDFVVDGKLVEIKGDHLKKLDDFIYKQNFCNKNNIQILSYDELLPIFKETHKEMLEKNLPLPRLHGNGER